MNMRLAEFQLGETIDIEKALKAFGERIESLSSDKLLLVKFVPFQYPHLSTECKPHKPVFDALEKYNLTERYSKGIQSVQDKDKDKEEEKDSDEILKASQAVLSFLNGRTGSAFRVSESNLKFLRARFKDGFTVEDCKAVISAKANEWMHDAKMKQYLRPATLFNAEKFESYVGQLQSMKPKDYAAKPTGCFSEPSLEDSK